MAFGARTLAADGSWAGLVPPRGLPLGSLAVPVGRLCPGMVGLGNVNRVIFVARGAGQLSHRDSDRHAAAPARAFAAQLLVRLKEPRATHGPVIVAKKQQVRPVSNVAAFFPRGVLAIKKGFVAFVTDRLFHVVELSSTVEVSIHVLLNFGAGQHVAKFGLDARFKLPHPFAGDPVRVSQGLQGLGIGIVLHQAPPDDVLVTH